MIRIEHVKHVPDHVLEPRLLQLFLELSANSDYAQVGVTMTLEVSTTVVLRLRRSIVFSLPRFPNQFPNQMCLLVLQNHGLQVWYETNASQILLSGLFHYDLVF